jgi:hypothetical protein
MGPSHPAAHSAWLEENCFHDPDQDDLGEHVAGLGAGRSSLPPVPRRSLPAAWTTVRRTIRLPITGGRAG